MKDAVILKPGGGDTFFFFFFESSGCSEWVIEFYFFINILGRPSD